FNMLVGRELQKAYGQTPQVVVTLPLLEGTDGVAKMSKSLNNAIGITEPPEEIFGKLMSISDAMMLRYYTLLTDEDGATIGARIAAGALHPMEAKKRLARLIVSRFSSAEIAQQVQDEFERRFQRRQLPAEMQLFEWPTAVPDAIGLAQIVTASGMVGHSKSCISAGS